MTRRAAEIIHILTHTIPDDKKMKELVDELFSEIGRKEEKKKII